MLGEQELVARRAASLLGGQTATGLRQRFSGLLLDEQPNVLGERRAIPSPRVRKRVLREKELDSDENLMRDRSDQEIKMAY